ncbi:MAG: hypothetical protein RLY93_19485 [Sumerlaeia bacterium]
MHFIYFQQSGKPVAGVSGRFWTLAGVAIPDTKWKPMQLRVNGLLKSFHKNNYTPDKTILDANDLLHPRNAEKSWTMAFCKGLERIVAGLEAKFFLVVIDKETTDKPAHPRWLLPLSYNYLMRPVVQYLRERDEVGSLIIPPGRSDEAAILASLQVENLFGAQGRHSPLVATPMVQSPVNSCGLQVADFVSTVTRRYHEYTFPKLYAKQVLEGYDAVINSHYQGFVKPNTYQSPHTDAKGYKIRGYIYLWRREGGSRDDISRAEVMKLNEDGTEENVSHDRQSESGDSAQYDSGDAVAASPASEARTAEG